MDRIDKRFVITGAARGIGLATARAAARRGASVVLTDVDDEAGHAAAASLVAAGHRAAYVHCDIAEETDVVALMDRAADLLGGIDVLVNNAAVHEGILTESFSFATLPVEVFDRVMSVNLRGTFLCSQKALPYLAASTRGPSIVNAGSTASFAGFPYCVAYGTSKGGIATITKNLAVALAPYGIRVNCYCPSSVDTTILRDVSGAIDARAPTHGGSSLGDTQIGGHLVGRIGRPEDIAELVCYLAGDSAEFVNGAVWLIDGGTLAWRDTLESAGMSPPRDRRPAALSPDQARGSDGTS